MRRGSGFGASIGTTAAVFAVLVFAFWVRLDGIAERTISHIESYAPGIPYPPGISDPPPRLDQQLNLTWALTDVHGPTLYLWMLPYAQAFGTKIATLRFPAVVFGVGSVLGVFFLGRRISGPAAGIAAAALLAGSGHHIFWSQRARFYAFAVFLGVWSTVLLLDLLERDTKAVARLVAYAAATLAGLTTLYYYWPLFAVQCLWAGVVEGRREPRLTSWLTLIAIGAAPVLTLAVYQARPAPYLEYADGQVLLGYLGFGFLFDPAIDSGVAEREQVAGGVWGVLAASALLLSTALAGVASTRPLSDRLQPPPVWLAAAAAVFATAVIVTAIGPAAEAFPHKTPLLWGTAALPALGLCVHCLKGWLLRALAGFAQGLASPVGLAWLLAFGPVAMVVAVHQYTPFYAPRGMALFSPFLIILLGSGLASLARRGRSGALVASLFALGLIPWNLQSVAIAQREPGAFEYRRLAEDVRRTSGPDEVILVNPHWSVTPLFYYWLDEADRLVGADWSDAVSQHRSFWFVEAVGQTPPEELAQLLDAWTPTARKSVRGLQATRYER